MVDTKYIGWFYKQDEKVQYLPNLEFYEAGKFKNKEKPDSLKLEQIVKVTSLFLKVIGT